MQGQINGYMQDIHSTADDLWLCLETKDYSGRWPWQCKSQMMDTLGQKSTAGAVFSDRFMYRTSVLESTGRLSQCPKCFKSHCLFVRGTLPCCMEMDGTGTGEGAEHISCIPRSVACSVFPLPLGERQRWGCFTISMFSLSLPPTSDSLSLPFLFLSERRDSQKSALAYSNSPTYHHFIDVFALDLDFFSNGWISLMWIFQLGWFRGEEILRRMEENFDCCK